MGLCASNELTPAEKQALAAEKKISKDLDKKMAQDNLEEQRVNKLLLLGSGESGKSTLFKQMIALYKRDAFNEDYRKTFTKVIYNNVLTAMSILCQNCERMDKDPAITDSVACAATAEMQLIYEINEDGRAEKPNWKMDDATARAITTLWEDAGIQYTYDNRAKFQMFDSADYFFKKIEEIAAEDYIPTEQDVLRSRVRTTGIVEETFLIQDTEFRMFDVGGQRNERKKWIHCFDDVTAIIFVAAISEYDQVLYEDENTNRMQESLALFHDVCNMQWLQAQPIIVFLNKQDLFEEKIKKVSLRTCFGDEYNLDEWADFNAEDGKSFIEDQYRARAEPNKKLYIHITTATDKTNMAKMFATVKDIVINIALEEVGMM